MHWEILSFTTTAPGASGAAATAVTGDSLTLRNAVPGTPIKLVNWWRRAQTAGFMQVTAPSLNDTTRGIRSFPIATTPQVLLPFRGLQILQPQELLSVTVAGSAVAGDVEAGSFLLYYENSPGLNGRYLTPEGVDALAVRMVTVQGALTLAGTGVYSGAVAINAVSDLLRPNTDYALLGYVVNTSFISIGIRSPDWSNVRNGGPGDAANPSNTALWWQDLSVRTGMPAIPVMNSGNKGGILIDGLADENGASVQFALNLVELLTES